MGSVKKTSSALLSTAAAALLASAPLTVSAQDGENSEVDTSIEGKCWGMNSCKGHSSCKGATNSCQGQNSCKGQGYLVLSLQTCLEMGGDFAEGDDFVPVEN